jgi:hypothetical protein
MASYSLYLIFTVIVAVVFQERCFVPMRTAIRKAFLKPKGTGGTTAAPRSESRGATRARKVLNS